MNVISFEHHSEMITTIFRAWGYSLDEAWSQGHIASMAALHGVHTHSGPKSIDLHRKFGHLLKVGDRVREPGPTTAYKAMNAVCAAAKRSGIGMLGVPQCHHYLWGGGYAIEAARRGLIFFTTHPGLLPEVAPHLGRQPSIGTNPHTWAFPTIKELGFPILIDWATSVISMSGAQSRESLPYGSAINSEGTVSCIAKDLHALLPMGGHKGWGLGLMTELLSHYIGSGVPSTRGNHGNPTGSAFFMAIDPKAISGRATDIGLLIDDILEGNPDTILPGQREHEAAEACKKAGGIILPDEHLEIMERTLDEVSRETASR